MNLIVIEVTMVSLKKNLTAFIIKKHPSAVKIERDHFQQFGGGCHLAVGITTRHANGHLVTSMRGTSDGKTIRQNAIENFKRNHHKESKKYLLA